MAKQRRLVPLNRVGADPLDTRVITAAGCFAQVILVTTKRNEKYGANLNAHNCHEDASQAAARIVREATKD